MLVPIEEVPSGSDQPWNLGDYRATLREVVERISAKYQAKFDESDIVQETLTEAYQHLHEFRGTSEQELKNWLKRMLSRNLVDAIRRLRSQKRNIQYELRISATTDQSQSNQSLQLAGQFTSPSFRIARSEELSRMQLAIGALPAVQQEAITLHHLQGMTLAEVANRMGKTPAAIAGLIHRGLRSLQKAVTSPE